MISRLLVIVLAFAATAFRVSQGAYVEAVGLAGLGVGLLILRIAPTRRWLAWIAFAVTAVSMAAVVMRAL